MKGYFSSLKTEIKNCIFILGISWKANKAFYFIKIPMLLMGIFSSFLPLISLRLILNEIEAGRDIKKLLLYAAGYAGALLVIALLNNFLGIVLDRQTKKTVYETKKILGRSVMKIPYSMLEQPRMKDFIQKAGSQDLFFEIINNLFSLISSVVTIVGLSAIIVSLQPIILVMIAAVVLVRLIAEKCNRKIDTKYREIFAKLGRKGSYLGRIINSVEYGKEVRVNNLQDWAMDKRMAACKEDIHQNKFQLRDRAATETLVNIAVTLQECLIYLILAYKVVFTGMLIGDFSMYMTGINNFTGCLQGIVSAFSNLRKNGEFANDLRYCIELSETSGEKHTNKHLNGDFDNVELEFRNVSFKYPNTDRMILKNISMKIKKGESLSLVGVNGAGKTTLVKLICRLYEPTEGEILINGIPVETIPYDQYSELLGVVFQDFKIFAFTAAENVALSTRYDEKRLVDCMDRSDILKKIESLPEGHSTFLSKEFNENGVELSGGEVQKLAIARTLYKDPPMIILDEPTSALDPIAEYEIYQKFHELVKGRTAVYISHRLSSTRFTDKIAVFADGELREFGSHSELMSIDDGVYKNMFEMQAQYYV